MGKNGVEKKLFWQRGPLRKDGKFEWYFLIVNMTSNIDATKGKLEACLSSLEATEIMGDTISGTGLNYELFMILSPSPNVNWRAVYNAKDRHEECMRLRLLALQRLEWGQDISQKIADIYRGRC